MAVAELCLEILRTTGASAVTTLDWGGDMSARLTTSSTDPGQGPGGIPSQWHQLWIGGDQHTTVLPWQLLDYNLARERTLIHANMASNGTRQCRIYTRWREEIQRTAKLGRTWESEIQVKGGGGHPGGYFGWRVPTVQGTEATMKGMVWRRARAEPITFPYEATRTKASRTLETKRRGSDFNWKWENHAEFLGGKAGDYVG